MLRRPAALLASLALATTASAGLFDRQPQPPAGYAVGDAAPCASGCTAGCETRTTCGPTVNGCDVMPQQTLSEGSCMPPVQAGGAPGCLAGGCDATGCTAGACGPSGCDAGGCGTGACGTGACGSGDADARRYSAEWWANRALDPPGQRQRCKFGKKWPVYPRPTGRNMTLIHRYHTAHAWPHPYICADRTAVDVAHELSIRAGWDEVATMHLWHFDAETGALNSAGRQHLMYLVTRAPSQQPRVYVARGDEGIESRLATVERAIVEIAGSNRVAVLPRDAVATTQPSATTERVHRLRLETMPPPQLSEAATGAAEGNSPTPQ